MDNYTAQEEAYKRGQQAGYAEGYRCGLIESGIAPIQWCDADKIPFRPDKHMDYIVLTCVIDPEDGEKTIDRHPRFFHHGSLFDEQDLAPIAFWCPITMPGEKAGAVYQDAPSRPPEGRDGSTRADILHAAERAVCGDRDKQYGSPEDNFGLIGQFWTTYTGTLITAVDVAAMMGLFKLGRIKTGVGTRDSWVDLAGYAACGGEIAAK